MSFVLVYLVAVVGLFPRDCTSAPSACSTVDSDSAHVAKCNTTTKSSDEMDGNSTTLTPPLACYSKVYCQGELLHDAAMMGFTYHQDKLKFPEDLVVKKYEELKKKENLTYAVMEQFLHENFEDGNEFEKWAPPDFQIKPSLLEKIKDPFYKEWASDLNLIWKFLARKVKIDVHKNPDYYSFLYVPHGFVIPGGMFKELYYWDSLWIENGLLLCDMHKTVKGVIENLLYLIKKLGFMPNASRKYFLNRSQPPMIGKMVENYYLATNDIDFLKENIQHLDDEFQYWMKTHMVTVKYNGKDYQMARYIVQGDGPRPESYRKDFTTAQVFETDEEKHNYYNNIKSAAESGMDFGSRWYIKDGSNKGNLSDIATSKIIPVDLNAFLHYNAELLSKWYFKLGKDSQGEAYRKQADEILQAIEDVMWDEEEGVWLDFDIENQKRRKYFYTSNLVPLWTDSYSKKWSKEDLSKKVLSYLNSNNIYNYTGIPNSLEHTGEQWDFPNAWPPMQAIIIQGLEKLKTPEAEEVAFRLASTWIETNYKGFKENKVMYEKYDVLTPGSSGGGGEYSPQSGFGWTNGVALEFLARYGDRLVSFDTKRKEKKKIETPVKLTAV